jgi:hypothetical protein
MKKGRSFIKCEAVGFHLKIQLKIEKRLLIVSEK